MPAIKTAFSPMVPRVDPRIAAKPAAPPPAVKKPPAVKEPVNPTPESQLRAPKPPEPLPTSVELWVEVVSRPDRPVFSWSFVGERGPDRKGVCMVLNDRHWIVEKAILETDSRAIALLLALALSETLITRQKRLPWVRATFKKLRELLLPEEQRHLAGSFQFLGGALASSEPFIQLGRELVAPGGGKKRLIQTVELATKL